LSNFNTHFVSDIEIPFDFNSHFVARIDNTTLFITHFVFAVERYFPFNISLVLEGGNDSLPDFEYRLKSFSTTQNSGDQSTFNFQMPKQDEAITAYNDRPNGDLVVYYKTQEIIRCNPQHFNYNVGATSQTFSIRGTKQTTYTDPKTLNIDDNRVESIKVFRYRPS